jgi:selenocysteine lyase/cysteine desulfurase
MKTNRRLFLKSSMMAAGSIGLAAVSGNAIASGLNDALHSYASVTPEALASEEDFWYWIQQSFTTSPNVINLNNGGVSPQPRVVQETFEHFNQLANQGPAYYMWQVLDEGRENVRHDLAQLAGCSPDTIAIQRNTTEALETVIFGVRLKKGDEVVLTKQDYPNMINAWKQREKRDGIVLKWISLPQPIEDDDAIVKAYQDAFTSRTKIIQIMHMINWNGQILPVAKIARAAHAQGIEVMVDGAHTYAHLNFTIPELECDYFGTSLHKWLFCPFGTGFLYVKTDKIKDLWPHCAPGDPEDVNIRKFEALGTRSFPAEMAIGKALEFHQMIGSERKEQRLRYLKDYWAIRVKNHPKVSFCTSFKPEYACGLANFAVEGMTPADLSKRLFEKYKIFTVSIDWENIKGVRVTPNVYTTTNELDYFVEAVLAIANG